MIHRTSLQKLLFLQLPRLENDAAAGENLPMAAFYLFHAVERAGLAFNCEPRWLTPEEEKLDDRHLLEKIFDRQPDILCCTLYLWNIERTLHLLRRVRQNFPRVKIITGFRSSVVLIPRDALVERGERRVVYAVEGEKVKVREVKVGAIEDSRVEIINGVKPGDLLVLGGQSLLADGQMVKPQEAGGAQKAEGAKAGKP
jgi:hypothetical protein